MAFVIYEGFDHGIASRGSYIAFEGKWVWDWKDRIDRKFMYMFQRLPYMPMDPPPSLYERLKSVFKRSSPNPLAPYGIMRRPNRLESVAPAIGPSALELLNKKTMRCGGCGSKVGAQV